MISDNFEKAKAFFEDGLKFFQEEKFYQAEINFLKSLDLVPQRLSTIRNLISIYIKTNEVKKLENFLEKNMKLHDHIELKYGLAFNFFFKKNYSKSMTLCQELLNHKDFKETIEDLLASNFKKKKLFFDALTIYKKKLKIKKNYLVFYNIGNLFSDLGRVNIAYYYYKKSLELKKDFSTLWNLSICSLKLKNFEYGFLLYENRWNKKENPGKKKFNQIRSLNSLEEIKNRKILVWDEQGLGDTIQFSRFLIDLLNFSKNITLVVDKKLKEILKNLDKNLTVTDYENLNSENFEYQIPICSLPKLLKIKNIKDIKYNKLEISKVKHFKLEQTDNLKIGIAWSGNPNYTLDEYRSIPFKNFKKLLNIKGINFYKLSQNVRGDEYLEYNSFNNLFDFGSKSIFEISQLMDELDLVISSDTSIIHLAGILNVKSFLLLNFNSDWRWFNDTEKTIWYPSVSIIKQKKLGEWTSVFTELETELKKLVISK